MDYYWHMDPMQHDVVIHPVSMSCLHAFEGKDTDTTLIWRERPVPGVLIDKGTHVRCDIDRNKSMT